MKITIRDRDPNSTLVIPHEKFKELLEQLEPLMNSGDILVIEGVIEF